MKIKKGFEFFLIALILITFASCGGGGVGGSGAVNMKATAQTNKQVVASLQKPTPIQRMLAFLSGKEANANHETFCTNKEFSLFGGGHVCVEKAYVVFDKVELERENPLTGVEDEVEFGPFIVDLAGFPNDGIPGEVNIIVPAGQAFDEVKFKVDDLDDHDGDGLQSDDDNHDGIDDDKDDIPVNVSLANIPPGLVKRSLLIIGSARNAANTTTKAFTFSTDIEARIKVPLSQTVFSGDNIITFFKFTTGFGNRTFDELFSGPSPITIEAIFNPSGSSSIKCSSPSLTAAQKLACDIVKNIDLFEDVDDDDVAEAGEDRGDNSGPSGFDDSGSAD